MFQDNDSLPFSIRYFSVIPDRICIAWFDLSQCPLHAGRCPWLNVKGCFPHGLFSEFLFAWDFATVLKLAAALLVVWFLVLQLKRVKVGFLFPVLAKVFNCVKSQSKVSSFPPIICCFLRRLGFFSWGQLLFSCYVESWAIFHIKNLDLSFDKNWFCAHFLLRSSCMALSKVSCHIKKLE